MTDSSVLLAVMVLLGVWCCARAYIAVSRGFIRSPGKDFVYRKQQPTTYWVLVVMWLLMGAGCIWTAYSDWSWWRNLL